jgi:hypothetical protein
MLADLILLNKPDYRELQAGRREQRVAAWAVDIERLIRLDGKSPPAIEAVIIWSQKDGFWHRNILSGQKLREKFDRLEMDMTKPDRKRIEKHAGIDQWLEETFYAKQ